MPNPVIVIPCFDKTHALKRLLSSLQNAIYPENVKLIFSVDGGGDPEVLRCADTFGWSDGKKEIIARDRNIGLRQNLLFCGGLSEQYGAVIVLEDDSYVSRDFYSYAVRAGDFYAGENHVAGISLYAYEYSELNKGRFDPLADGANTFFIQWAGSRAQLSTADRWASFHDWYEQNRGTDLFSLNIPDEVAAWPESSWKKYCLAYLVAENKYFVYPHVSFVSNCGDIGANCGKSRLGNREFAEMQVCLPLKQDTSALRFATFSSSAVKYDAFFEIDPECLKANSKLSGIEFDVDLTGAKRHKNYSREYILSCKKCTNPVISFDHVLMPLALNVIQNCPGDYLSLGRVDDFVERDGLETRVHRYIVNRTLPSDKRSLEFLLARSLKELISVKDSFCCRRIKANDSQSDRSAIRKRA